jgi:hypothetical protein
VNSDLPTCLETAEPVCAVSIPPSTDLVVDHKGSIFTLTPLTEYILLHNVGPYIDFDFAVEPGDFDPLFGEKPWSLLD